MLTLETVEPPDLFFEDFAEGQEFSTVTKRPMMVSHQVRWAGACDNYDSEFHHDEHVAKAQGLPGIILSGPLMASYLMTEANAGSKGNGRGPRAAERAADDRSGGRAVDIAVPQIDPLRRRGDARARLSRHCGAVAAPVAVLLQQPRPPHRLSFGRATVHGEDGYEFHEPLIVGDEITLELTITGAHLKQGRSGPLGMIVAERRFTNQLGALCAMLRTTLIRR